MSFFKNIFSKSKPLVDKKFVGLIVDVRDPHTSKNHLIAAEKYVVGAEIGVIYAHPAMCGNETYLFREDLKDINPAFLHTRDSEALVKNTDRYCSGCVAKLLETS